MRRLFLALLLATTAATPAFSQSSGEQRREAREQARAEKAERAERREQRRERAEERSPQVRAPALVPTERQHVRRPAIDRAVERGRPSAVEPSRQTSQRHLGERGHSVANWRRAERAQQRGSLGETLSDRVHQRRATPPADARPDRPAPPPRTATRRAGSPRWHSSWHRDHRYNWRDHRRRNRFLFRLGFYFDPFGWSYRRYDRGWRLWPSYYDSSYWLRDPLMYRLPHAPYPYQWVRYWNDALLVDTYSGEVVDVVHDVFW